MAKYHHLMMEEVMCNMLVVLTLIPHHTVLQKSSIKCINQNLKQSLTKIYYYCTMITCNNKPCTYMCTTFAEQNNPLNSNSYMKTNT